MSVEIYGIAFQSPAIIYYLVPPKKYSPVLLVTATTSQIKADVAQATQDGKLPVILAGSLDIAQMFLKLFPKLPCKLILFDYPSFLVPFYGTHIRWLDCDHQAGGAWQIAKVKPEDFKGLLETLNPLSDSAKTFLNSMRRFIPKDRTSEIESFSAHLPKSYKELLADVSAEDKSPLKIAKESRRNRDSLKDLVGEALTDLTDELRNALVSLVLDYQLALLGKREFLTKLNTISTDEKLKKTFLGIRKWVDSKSGSALQDAFLDFSLNSKRRSWSTVLDTHKKVGEEDLIILLSYENKDSNALQNKTSKLDFLEKLPSDKQNPKAPYHPTLVKLDELFNYTVKGD